MEIRIHTGPLSLSGVEIQGDNLMRFIYVDETGISVNDSIALVAGVIINADEQWKAVEKHIVELIDEYIPKEHQERFSFHATDLYHGSGKVFGGGKYPRARAREALKHLVSIPRKFGLPITVGYIDKRLASVPEDFAPRARDKAALYHSCAFALCAVEAERYMRTMAPDEVAQMVAENNTDTHKVVKAMHKILRAPWGPAIFATMDEQMRANLPIRRIVDCVMFAEKDDAILLQIADACALFFRLWAKGKSDQYVNEYLDALTDNRRDQLGQPQQTIFHGCWTFPTEPVA